jgi:hypothetical protein
MDLWATFNCPQCGKLLRLRRNYTARLLRLLFISLAVWLVGIYIWATYDGLKLGLVTLTFIGVVEGTILEFLPTRLEIPGGGLGISLK